MSINLFIHMKCKQSISSDCLNSNVNKLVLNCKQNVSSDCLNANKLFHHTFKMQTKHFINVIFGKNFYDKSGFMKP